MDATHSDYQRFKDEAETRHRVRSPLTNLSVVENAAGTEALIKVAGGRGWTPPLGITIEVFGPDDDKARWALVYSRAWNTP